MQSVSGRDGNDKLCVEERIRTVIGIVFIADYYNNNNNNTDNNITKKNNKSKNKNC